MEEGETELETSGGMMQLLDEHLPSHTDEFGWDVPLIACLADALSLTAQLGPIISALVRHSVRFKKKEFARSSEQALRMLEDAVRRVLEVFQRDFKASQSFVALALARELIVHCVILVEAAMRDEVSEQRFDNILGYFVQLLQVSFVPQEADLDSQTELGHFKDQNLKVDSFPTAFTPLYVVAATRRSRNPLPTNIAIGQLFGAVAMKAAGSDLHHLLDSCKAEAVAFSNILGLSMLVPVQTDHSTVHLIKCLGEIGCEDEALSKHAAERFSKLCSEKHNNFYDLLQCLRSVGEFVCMQCPPEDEQTMQKACKTAHDLDLHNSLGPAATLLCNLEADDNMGWDVDLLSMDGERAWQTSIMAHLLCFLGASHKSINKENLPPAVRPFTVFHDLDQSTLNSTFWPGVPDDWWQALRYSGLHTHLFPISGNIVWAQCHCGYRYCYANCGAPASSDDCASPEGEGSCKLRNGGQGHQFAPGQRLIAVVVTKAPHGADSIFSTMRQNFPEAFQPPAPSPGLFALTEADLHTSVKPEGRAVVSHSLISETVRQNWNEPLGKPPSPSSGLHPVSFRVLHLLVHASALLSIEMERVEKRTAVVNLLQQHLRDVARMNCVRNPNDTVWYLMASIEADLAALAQQLNGTVEVATLFVHAVLHKLGSLEPFEQPTEGSLTSHSARVAYENWFHRTVAQPVLGEKGAAGDFSLPGVHALRREAGQATDPSVVLTTDFLSRRGLPTDAWTCMKASVRASLLPHVLRPLVFATPKHTLQELAMASHGGRRFVLLSLLMPGLDDDGSWHLQPDLLRAASLAWILPFMRLVRDKEGGKITMRAARTTTIRKWLDGRENHEMEEAWTLRNCEAAWNASLASDNVRVACHFIPLPALSEESPLALVCPIVEPEKLRHGDLPIGDHPDPPEHVAAVALHTLAVSHNKIVSQLQSYLNPDNEAGAHVQARLHPSASCCTLDGQCLSGEKHHEGCVRLIQHATPTDLFIFASQLGNTCEANDSETFGPRKFQLDYKIDSFLNAFFQIPWGADLPARGDHDFQAMENDLAWRLVASRRPLQVSSEDCKGFHQSCLPSANSAWGRCQHHCFDFDHSNLWKLNLCKPYI